MTLWPGPDPYSALRRVLALKRPQQRALTRLEVWCEKSKCTPLRVFALREGALVQCRSDADVSDMQATYPHLEKWSRRRAFFVAEWLDQPEPKPALQVVCSCDQTTPRLVDVARLVELIPAGDAPTFRTTLPAVAAADR